MFGISGLDNGGGQPPEAVLESGDWRAEIKFHIYDGFAVQPSLTSFGGMI
jgi:hypothetical protein